ncbi:hypothetical protein DFH06DRAFT_1405464 [Mycena polygramma]|nr:hypothetical protein DFH06DRAFT_1405464 [Mycena polygramma]
MLTVHQTITLFQAFFGDALPRFFALFGRGGVRVDDVERVSTLVGSDADIDAKSVNGHELVIPAPVLELESTLAELTGSELISAAVAADLCSLPSLPSILKSPKARLPPTTSTLVHEKQEFGQPSKVFYEHRLPFGNVTNLPRFGAEQKGMKLDNLQVKALAPRVKSRSRAKKARPVQIPVIIVVDTDAVSAAQSLKSDPACGIVNVFESLPAPASILNLVPAPDTVPKFVNTPKAAPAPGSPEWNDTKAAVLAQAQTWTDHIKASRRISLPAPAPIPVPAPVKNLVPQASKRHSAPPVLGTPRKTLQDRLSALLARTTDTIAALDKDSEKIYKGKKGEIRINHNGVPEIGEAIKEARRYSAVALEEGRQLFSIGEDPDDEDEDDTPLGELFEARRRRNDSIV